MPDSQHEKNSIKLQKLREIMEKLKFKDDIDFAKAINISQGYLSEIINGKKYVPKTMASRLRKSLNISESWFDDNQGGMFLGEDFESNTESLTEKEKIIEILTNSLNDKERLYQSLIAEKDERLKDKDIIIATKDEALVFWKEKAIEYEKKISTSTPDLGNEGHVSSRKRSGK